MVSPYRSFRNVGRFFSSVKWRADVLMPSPIVCVLGRVCLSCILFEGFVFIRRIFFVVLWTLRDCNIMRTAFDC